MFKNLFKSKKTVDFYAFLEGKTVLLENVPDEVFSQKMMGDGIAIQPTSTTVCAPCAGEIVFVAPTNHAYGIKTEDGIEMLIHLGLETVSLKDDSLKPLVNVGDKVEVHQEIAKFSDSLLNNSDINMISMLVFTNFQDYEIKEYIENDVNTNDIILKLGKVK